MVLNKTDTLKDRMRQVLLEQARTENLLTYKNLADRLRLVPPQTIHRVAEALEVLMAEDVAAGRPLLAALCVSRLQGELPALGFFVTAQALGIFKGDPEGAEAGAFHAREIERVRAFYR